MEEMKLPKGIRKKGNGYEARAMIDGTKVTVRGTDLDQVMADFIAAKEQAISSLPLSILLFSYCRTCASSH